MKLGLAGLGTIGAAVLRHLAEHDEGFDICGICVRSADKARALLEETGIDAPLLSPGDLAERAEIVVEAVPSSAFLEIATPAIEHGRVLVTVSGSAILDAPELVARAKERGARIILATGALIGLDAVRAAAIGQIKSVSMVTRKPPASLKTAAYVIENTISLDNLTGPKKLFEGRAREGCVRFPANVNVAAALSLAGIGPDKTRLEIWADPGVERNTHTITVDADSARFTMEIENIPSKANPATGKITALSVLAALRGLTAPLRVGS